MTSLRPIPNLGNRIALARRRKGILQREVAERVGTTARQLQQFEIGGAPVPPLMRFALSQALGVPPAEFDAPNLVEATA